MASFCIGTMLGWVSPMQPLLESSETPVGDRPLTREEISWLGSINFIGAIIGSFIWGELSDWLGRKTTGVIISIPFSIGWLIILLSDNVYTLYIGRIIIGVGCSGAIINNQMFSTEISEDAIRGTLGSFLMFSLNMGCLFCYIVGAYASFTVLTSLCLAIPVAYGLIFMWVPETPIHLYRKNKKRKAESSLTWYRGGDIVQVEKEMSRYSSQDSKKAAFSELWRSRGTVKALLISFGFVFGQQFNGILAILTYTVTIFKESGTAIDPYHAGIIVGCLQLVGSFLSSILVDKAGRRVLLTGSFSVLALALITLSGYYTFQDALDEFGWIPVLCLSAHVVAYSVGGGPLPFVVMGEMFPARLRGRALSLVQLLNTTLSFATVKLFPVMKETMGGNGCFFFYGACCVLLTVFVVVCVPETKGKSINSILRRLNNERDEEGEAICNPQTVSIVKASAISTVNGGTQ